MQPLSTVSPVYCATSSTACCIFPEWSQQCSKGPARTMPSTRHPPCVMCLTWALPRCLARTPSKPAATPPAAPAAHIASPLFCVPTPLACKAHACLSFHLPCRAEYSRPGGVCLLHLLQAPAEYRYYIGVAHAACQVMREHVAAHGEEVCQGRSGPQPALLRCFTPGGCVKKKSWPEWVAAAAELGDIATLLTWRAHWWLPLGCLTFACPLLD